MFVKRDDLYPYYFGGNKARKVKLFQNDIRQQGANYVVTYGSSSSNHCRAVAAMAATDDIPCLIISPEESKRLTANKKMASFFGAEYVYCDIVHVADTIEKSLNDLRQKGYNPYFIPGGGHGNLGTQAYVDAYREIVAFEQETKIAFDYIFFASGTGTTQAGLVCGKFLFGRPQQHLIGISIARENPRGRQVVLDSIREYLGNSLFPESEVTFLDKYICSGYGNCCKEEVLTIRKQLKENGLPLDLTYTGKAFWGMEQYIQENKITDKNILFIHTGGTPLFYDDLEQLI